MNWKNPFGIDTEEALGDRLAAEASGVGQRDDPEPEIAPDEVLGGPEAGGRRLPLRWPEDVAEPPWWREMAETGIPIRAGRLQACPGCGCLLRAYRTPACSER